jgi:hypothetical protein
MDYKTAQEKLVEHLNTWKPDGEIAEVLDKAIGAFNDCMELGLTGQENEIEVDKEFNDPISTDEIEELAYEIVLPEMLVYPGEKLSLDFIVEKSHFADHRANKGNVRLALGKLECSSEVIELDPEKWAAIRSF